MSMLPLAILGGAAGGAARTALSQKKDLENRYKFNERSSLAVRNAARGMSGSAFGALFGTAIGNEIAERLKKPTNVKKFLRRSGLLSGAALGAALMTGKYS